MSVNNLGHATAYGYATSKGYTGTEEEFAELMASYADVAQDAQASAEAAAGSATAAAGSANTATTAAQTATTKANEAAQSATGASQSATQAASAVSSAQASAQTATAKASEASQSAANAAASATTANNAADDATAAKTAAETAKTAAQQSATSAATSAQTAQQVLEDIPEDYSDLSNDVSDLLSAFSEIAEYKKSTNLLDPSQTLSHGFISPSDGSFSESESFRTTDFVPVEGGKYFISSNNVPAFDRVRFISEWDADKTIIRASTSSVEGSGDGTHYSSAYVMLTANTAYVRVSYQLTAVDLTTRMFSQSDAAVLPSFTNYFEPYYTAQADFIKDYVRPSIHIYETDGIDGFYNKMYAAYLNGNTDVHIHKGTYTYTNAFVESIRANGKRGVPIGYGNKYIFEQGAELVCEYTGTESADVVDLFSPLDTWNVATDFEIVNLKLTAKNVCYALHDEASGGDTPIVHKYTNCIIRLDNTALGDSGNSLSKAIGGGLGRHELIAIENCIFSAINPAMTSSIKPAVSYHGANGSTFTDANISVTGCYFESGTLQGSNLGTNIEAPYPTLLVTNCSLPQIIGVADTWTSYLFNNIIR